MKTLMLKIYDLRINRYLKLWKKAMNDVKENASNSDCNISQFRKMIRRNDEYAKKCLYLMNKRNTLLKDLA